MALLLLAVVLTAVAAAGAVRDPRDEQIRLNAADNALAKRIALRAADLGRGWRKLAVTQSDDEPLRCTSFNPDLSAFTITGKAASAHSRSTGSSAASTVEVYKSRADAIGDFRAAAKPQVARCLREVLEDQMADQGGGLFTLRVQSSKVVPAPKVGDRRIAYRLVAELGAQGVGIPAYLDILGFQRGRSIAALFFTGVSRPIAGRAEAARRVAARMR
jgi:hypothetical protein